MSKDMGQLTSDQRFLDEMDAHVAHVQAEGKAAAEAQPEKVRGNRRPHECTNCGKRSSGWVGQCPGCMGWNTLEEVAEPKEPKRKKGFAAKVREEMAALEKQGAGARLAQRVLQLDQEGGGLPAGSQREFLVESGAWDDLVRLVREVVTCTAPPPEESAMPKPEKATKRQR